MKDDISLFNLYFYNKFMSGFCSFTKNDILIMQAVHVEPIGCNI